MANWIIKGAGLAVVFVAVCSSWLLHPANAQERPPDEDLRSMIEQLTTHHGPASKVAFADHPSLATPCRMLPADMVSSRDGGSKSFPVLIERQRGEVKSLFAKLSRISVDADGAGRSYHPDDPLGENVCGVSSNSPKQVCALDNVANAGMRLFFGSTRLKKSKDPSDSQGFLSNWRGLWPLIRDEKLTPLSLAAIIGSDGPRQYNLFYWPERHLTFAFNTEIVPPTRRGYPCRYGRRSKYAGYFLSSTTLVNQRREGDHECPTNLFMNSAVVPFFVIPAEKLDGIGLGDLAIGFLATATSLRVVYGIVGDIGPFNHFGEGSIAFNKTLLGVQKEIANARDVDSLDIDLASVDQPHGPDASLSVLLLGGTRKLLNANFNSPNVRRVGQAQLKQWRAAASVKERVRACLEVAP